MILLRNTPPPPQKKHFFSFYLAHVVRADGGDGLEGQLLAANAHEDLLHLTQEVLQSTKENVRFIFYLFFGR